MNKKQRIAIARHLSLGTLVSMLLMLGGCSNEESNAEKAGGELRLTTVITSSEATRANDPLNVPDRQIAEGQLVGIFAISTGAGGEFYSNFAYEADGSGSLTPYSPDGFSTPIYFPADGSALELIAYHPHKSNITMNGYLPQPYDFAVATDQRSLASFTASDLLYAPSQKLQRASVAFTLQFAHVLSKLTYRLKPGAGITRDDLDGATVTIVKPECAVQFAPVDGRISTPTTSQKVDVTAGEYFGAVLPPQTFAAGSFKLCVTLSDGSKLYYTPETAQVFEEGNAYHYKITVNRTKLIVTSSVTDWQSGGTIAGDGEMPNPIGIKTDPTTAVVGDFYLNDGSLVGKDATMTAEQKAACIGIVMKMGKDVSGNWMDDCNYKMKDGITPMNTIHGYVLALHDAHEGFSCRWGLKIKIDHPDMNRNKNTGFYGYRNTQAIISFAEDNNYELENNFTATYFAVVEYESINNGKYAAPFESSGWFLPSSGQCKYFYNNKDFLLEQVKKATGNNNYTWRSYYWSSSEYDASPQGEVWVLKFYNKDTSNNDKFEFNNILPCLAF